jgi:RHS repeat-associated protein
MGAAEAAVTQGELYYVHNDHLGTPQVMTDRGGIQVWRAVYDPFGRATVNTTTNINLNVRFPGQYHDIETGFYYNYFRYYDPQLGRYLTSDPIDLDGGPNTYAYAELNPVRYSDEFGLFVKLCSRGLGDKNKPATSKNNPFRHEFLNVSGTFVGFQAGDNLLWSQGRVEIGKNIELDGGRCHTTICNDDRFDQYVLDAARSIPPPTYCVLATKNNIGILLTGARNCQTWALEVIEKAKEEYRKNEKCPQCFK